MPRIPEYEGKQILSGGRVGEVASPSDFAMAGRDFAALGGAVQNFANSYGRLAKTEKVLRNKQESDEYANITTRVALETQDKVEKSPELMSDGRNRVELFRKYFNDAMRREDASFKFTQDWSKTQGRIHRQKIENDFVEKQFISGRKDFFAYKKSREEEAVNQWSNNLSINPENLDTIYETAKNQYNSMREMTLDDGTPVYSDKEITEKEKQVLTSLVTSSINGHIVRGNFKEAMGVLRSPYANHLSPKERVQLEKDIVVTNRAYINDTYTAKTRAEQEAARKKKELTEQITNMMMGVKLEEMDEKTFNEELVPAAREAAKAGYLDTKVLTWIEKYKKESRNEFNNDFYNMTFAKIANAKGNELKEIRKQIISEMGKKDSQLSGSTGRSLIRDIDSKLYASKSSNKQQYGSYKTYIRSSMRNALGIMNYESDKTGDLAVIEFEEIMRKRPDTNPRLAASEAIKIVTGKALTELDPGFVKYVDRSKQSSVEGLNEELNRATKEYEAKIIDRNKFIGIQKAIRLRIQYLEQIDAAKNPVTKGDQESIKNINTPIENVEKEKSRGLIQFFKDLLGGADE